MKYILFSLLFPLFCVGCYNEDVLVATERPEFKYSLPQGAHEYDDKIVDWFKRGDFYILYKFEPKDVYFDGSYWIETTWDSASHIYNGNILVEVAEEEFVEEQLMLIEEMFLEFYPDTILRRCMPMKLLLCSSLKREPSSKQMHVYSGYDYLAVNWGNEQIRSLSNKEKLLFKNEVNKTFFKRIYDKKLMAISEDFTVLSPYGNRVEKENMYEQGFLKDSYVGLDEKTDWMSYIEVILEYPYTFLCEEPEDGDYSMKGILHPKKDSRGLINLKYEILTKYLFDTYGVDIQKIGDK